MLSFSRLVHKGTRSGLYSSHSLTILSSLPDHLVEHVCGLDHLGSVEHQVDVVVLRRDCRLERGTSMRYSDICSKRHLRERHLCEVRGKGTKLGEGERH